MAEAGLGKVSSFPFVSFRRGDDLEAQGCSLFPAGSTVTTSAGSNSGIAAGNPFLQQTDSSVSNACAGGPLPDRTDATPQ